MNPIEWIKDIWVWAWAEGAIGALIAAGIVTVALAVLALLVLVGVFVTLRGAWRPMRAAWRDVMQDKPEDLTSSEILDRHLPERAPS